MALYYIEIHFNIRTTACSVHKLRTRVSLSDRPSSSLGKTLEKRVEPHAAFFCLYSASQRSCSSPSVSYTSHPQPGWFELLFASSGYFRVKCLRSSLPSLSKRLSRKLDIPRRLIKIPCHSNPVNLVAKGHCYASCETGMATRRF